jgi:hypothetical protein
MKKIPPSVYAQGKFWGTHRLSRITSVLEGAAMHGRGGEFRLCAGETDKELDSESSAQLVPVYRIHDPYDPSTVV